MSIPQTTNTQDDLPKTVTKFLWYFVKEQRTKFVLLMLSMSCWAVQEAIYPYFIKLIIDKLTEYRGDKKEIFHALSDTLTSALIIVLVIEVGFRAYDYISIKFYPNFKASIRRRLFSYVQYHSHNYFSKNYAGTIASRIYRFPDAAQDIVEMLITVFWPVVLTFLLSSILLFQANPIFAGIILSWFFTHMSVTIFFSSKCRYYSMLQSEKLSTLNGKIVDSLSNIISVRLFANYKFERRYLDRFQNEELKAAYRYMHYNFVMQFWLSLVTWLFLFAMVLGSIYCYRKDMLSLGDVVLILSYHNLIGLVWHMGMYVITLSELIGVCKEGLNIVNQKYDVVDKDNAQDLHITSGGEIKFDNVSFNYARNNNVFSNVSTIIPSRQRVGLVGFSGSGKTTFINLILRYFDLAGGNIFIDNQNIAEVKQDSLRQAISVIPQDSALFHRTVMENIRYGKLDATDEEVYEAAKKAHAHDFIMKFPEQYNNMVGERGSKLSGGQRQRIAIARAILKNAPILILDEATSALDSNTEQQIQQALEQLMMDKTVLVIAHRLSTLLHMDRILVFDNGHIVEDGTHNQLLEVGGYYAKLWNMQTSGMLPEEYDDEDEAIEEEEE
jgi:ATP-binding cassette subfamily B protein